MNKIKDIAQIFMNHEDFIQDGYWAGVNAFIAGYNRAIQYLNETNSPDSLIGSYEAHHFVEFLENRK